MCCGRKCGEVCAKCTLITFNVIFLVFGIATLGVGIWFLLDPRVLAWIDVSGTNSAGSLGRSMAIICTTAGAVTLVISLLGIIGACAENKGALITYILLVVLLIVLQVVGVITAFIHFSWLDERLNAGMVRYLQEDYMGTNISIDRAYDRMQQTFECCGVNNRTEWQNSKWYRELGNPNGWSWPQSCCLDGVTDAVCKADQQGQAYTKACYEYMRRLLRVFSVTLAGCYLLFIVLQAGMIGAAGGILAKIKRHENMVFPSNTGAYPGPPMEMKVQSYSNHQQQQEQQPMKPGIQYT